MMSAIFFFFRGSSRISQRKQPVALRHSALGSTVGDLRHACSSLRLAQKMFLAKRVLLVATVGSAISGSDDPKHCVKLALETSVETHGNAGFELFCNLTRPSR